MGASLTIKPLQDWGISHQGPFIIAGPCSAESEEQLVETAQGLKGLPVSLLRAGIWKPRTRPGCFEGVGEKGLAWLKAAGEAAGIPVTTEVATPQHVEACLKAGIDVLWIGARTTVNPFSVQPIADALKGVDIPVMVKNPINPDIELWLGTMERLNQSGITKLAAIHRGFTAYKKSKFRNKPNWKIPIELRRRVPDLPMFCDPSHISGVRSLVPEVAQTALDLTFDGLMIESHINPSVALSDAKQQLTPADLGKLLETLTPTKSSTDGAAVKEQILAMRTIIDEIDKAVIGLVAQRMEVAKSLGKFKKQHNISLFQPRRWKETLMSRIESGVERGLSEDFLLRVYQYIHEESIRHQEEATRQ
jgi:chorismate mutase